MSYRVIKICRRGFSHKEWHWPTIRGAAEHAQRIVFVAQPGDLVIIHELRPIKFLGIGLGRWWCEISRVKVTGDELSPVDPRMVNATEVKGDV